MSDTTDLAELKRLAEAANRPTIYMPNIDGEDEFQWLSILGRFQEAAHPQAVLALIARAEAAEAELATVQVALRRYAADWKGDHDELTRLRAANARMAEALKPFVRECADLEEFGFQDNVHPGNTTYPMGDLRAAAKALEP